LSDKTGVEYGRMNYDDDDFSDEFYDEMQKRLYPEMKGEAIEEFTDERLRSFYIDHPRCNVPCCDGAARG